MGLKAQAVLIATSITVVGSIGLGSVALVNHAFGGSEKAAVGPAPTPPLVLEWSMTPSHDVIETALNAPYDPWVGEPLSTQISPSALPISCLNDISGPVGSMTRNFVTPDAGEIEVTLAAYSAGVGAVTYNAFKEALDNCGSSNVSDVEQFGAESTLVTTAPGGVNVNTVIWRRGDLLGFVSTPGDALNAAKLIDANVEPAINPVCVNQISVPEESNRNPWLFRDTFAGLTQVEPVSVPDPGLPKLPVVAPTPAPTPSSKTPAPTPTPTPTPTKTPVVETPIPAPELPVAFVERPRKPSYPVHPELPAVMDAPTLPEAPVMPGLTSEISVSVEDVTGPGCGWLFAGTVNPLFDSVAATNDATAKRDAATVALQTALDAWQNQVLLYWTDYAVYTDNVAAYNEYANQVSLVQQEWDIIAAQWNEYYRLLANYNAEVTARDNFIANKDFAQKQYDAGSAACLIPIPDPTPEPTPDPTVEPTPDPTVEPTPEPTDDPSVDPSTPPTTNPTPNPSPTPNPTPTPTRNSGNANGSGGNSVNVNGMLTVTYPPCPERPVILDQEPPVVGEKPATPPDPRP